MNKNPILDYVSQGMNDDDILQQLAQAVGQYSPLDLLSKISVSSFLLKTDFFSDYQTLDNKWMAYQDALHFLIPFLGCRKLGSGEKLISPKDLDDLVSSIQRIGMLRIEKSDSESESKISYGQTEATEVLPYFDSFYIDGLLPAESPVLEKAFGISGETIVADLHTAVERQHMNPPPNGDLSPVSFSFFIEHFKDFVDEPSFSLTADLKSSALFSQLSFGIGEFPEADFDMLSPLGLYDKKRKCFLSISGIPYCFDTEVFTSRLAKGVERLASTSDASSKEWALLKKTWTEGKTKEIFLEGFPGCEYFENAYYGDKKGQLHEVDGVLLYQNFLFDVEVKAGKADPDSVLADPKKVIDSYRAIVEGGIRECDSFSAFCEAHKTIDIRASNGKIKKSVPKERIKAIVPIVIFYEEMGCFLPGFTSTEGPAGKQRPTLLNVFDFLTIIDYLQSPLLATKYLYERSYPTVCDRLSFDDELPFLSIFTNETVNLAVFLSKMKEKVESFPEATQARLDDGNLSRDIEKYYMNLKRTRKPDFHFPKLVELLLKNEDAFDAEFFDLAFDLLGNEPEDFDRIYAFYFKANSGSKNVPQLLRPSSKKENEEGIVLAKRPSSPYDKKLLLSFLAFYFNRYPELTALNVIKIRREEASFERITRADSAINDPGVQEESKKLILLMEDTEI